ncbi:Polyketide synthetase [Mycena sanguinolenta]|uniref:Polyketide synthetase n=1 Tax=Mycena sanguinolenta TaxID=230812 RepID=A0A8H6Y3Z3_9AGAR|nr:Polyketide synthetase [Mycena sanguinolenta]
MHLISGPGPAPAPTATRTSSVSPTVVAIYPMTRAQESLWLAYLATPQHTMYNLTMKLSFDASNSVHSLKKLLEGVNMVTTRHGILRSTFHEDRNMLARPFVAEWEAHSAKPSVQVLSKPTVTALNSALRSPVELSSQFAVRWIISESEATTDLYLVAHHIAVDGISMSVLSAELLDFLLDSASFIAESNNFYRTHMIEAAYRASPAFKTAEDFWLSQCRSVVPVQWKESPQAPGSVNYREIENWFQFSKGELQGWSARFKTSWFRVAVALIGLLVRLSSEPTPEDHALLVAFAGRPEGMDKLVGHFTNALPIRIPLTQILRSETPTYDALVQLVSKAVSTAKKHDQFSFVDLRDSLRKGSLQKPQFQVAITLSPQLAGPNCSLYPVEGACDLFFCFLEDRDGVSLGVIYDPLIFSAAMLAKFKNRFQELLDSALTGDPLDSTSFPPLSTQIPCLFPNLDLTNTDQISATRFHSMFEYQVARNPLAIALASAEEHKLLAYGELNQKSNQIARLLRKSGVQRNKIVLLHLKRGFPAIEWILGVLKSGAAFAVADQSHPLERIRNVISVAQPDLIVDDGNGQCLANLAAVTLLDTRNINLDEISANDLQNISEPTDLAFVVFTSGSSGQPKGVEIEHRNLSHLVVGAHASGYFPVFPGSRVLQFAPFSFDAAIFELSLCLALGGTLCFSKSPHALVGDYLADVIHSNRITHMHLTPSILATLSTDRALPSLCYISIGGEMAQESVIELWRARANIQNGYGPSECTIAISHQSYSRGTEDKQASAANVGKPHAHTMVFICDETFARVLPTDQVGEICIGGPQVGRGYHNQQGLTEMRFAYHSEVGQWLYRTGDRGKILSDGSIYLLGRIDREVKVRGHRINLEDVERTIMDLVPEAVNVSAQINSAGTSLCVFVVPETVNGDEVKSRLGAKLPRYMVPSAVHCLARLPLNVNGKTDHVLIGNTRDDLITAAQHSRALGSTTLPSGQSYTSLLQIIWQTLLALDNLPQPESNFFRTRRKQFAAISARTAYHLNLQGPNITLNTACSSGLVAMSLAVDHLRSKRCDVAVVGGVSITFPQTGYITTQQSLLSCSGHCHPFDHRANGTIPGDAVCALVLCRLDEAVKASDRIYSVISGIALGSDGDTGKAGPTVPSSHGQAQTIKRAWEDAGISATKLFYAELHGSGTPIGDALELEGMNLARTELGAGDSGFIAGSNKGNIGNCEAASGLVSVIKICKSFQHGLIPPVQSFKRLHPIINPRIPVQIAGEAVPISNGLLQHLFKNEG